jgi:hypothetical protein
MFQSYQMPLPASNIVPKLGCWPAPQGRVRLTFDISNHPRRWGLLQASAVSRERSAVPGAVP